MALNPDRQTYKPGETMTFSGTLTNQNNYPIVNGEVFVKIYRVDPRDGGNPQNGHFEIAEFSGLKDLNLGSNQKKEVIFTYKLPRELASGNYLAHFFFDVAGKYNLSGLSFHPAMPGAMTPLTINSDLEKSIYFDKDNVLLNGQKYNYRAPNDQQAKDKDVVIKIPLVNPTSQKIAVKLKKELYFWDALNVKNMIGSSEEQVELPATGEKEINYVISSPSYAVYLVKLTAESNQGVSVINVRPVVRDISQLRLNFPALASFPLVKGQKSVMFSCFHNAALGIEKGKVVMTLRDNNEKIIATNIFEGDIYGNMMATAKEFTPAQDYVAATLTTELYDSQGKLVDLSVQKYDCGTFNPSICATKPKVSASPITVGYPPSQGFNNELDLGVNLGLSRVFWSNIIAIIVVLAILLSGAGFIVWHTKKKRRLKNKE